MKPKNRKWKNKLRKNCSTSPLAGKHTSIPTDLHKTIAKYLCLAHFHKCMLFNLNIDSAEEPEWAHEHPDVGKPHLLATRRKARQDNSTPTVRMCSSTNKLAGPLRPELKAFLNGPPALCTCPRSHHPTRSCVKLYTRMTE